MDRAANRPARGELRLYGPAPKARIYWGFSDFRHRELAASRVNEHRTCGNFASTLPQPDSRFVPSPSCLPEQRGKRDPLRCPAVGISGVER